MFGFQALCVSFSSFPCIIFEHCVFPFEFSVLLISKRPFSRHDVPCVLRSLRIATICGCKRHRGKFKMFRKLVVFLLPSDSTGTPNQKI